MKGRLLFTAILITLVEVKSTSRLYEETSPCGADVKRLCPPGSKNEFSVAGCLQREIESDSSAVSKECHNELWTFKNNVMTDKRYIDQMKKQCPDQITTVCKDRAEDAMACLLEHRQDIENSGGGSTCKRYLKSMAVIFFSDYHLIAGFLKSCSDDVTKLKCGVISTSVDESANSQVQVVSCLEGKIKQVSAACKSVLEVKEEQAADSFQLDRALFMACRTERQTLCKNAPDSAGEVYDCLGRYKFDKRVSSQCRKEVVRRQLMILSDYKIDYGLKKSCGYDLVTQQCIDPKKSKRLQEGFMRTVLLLQCLTEIDEIGDQKRVPISESCMREVGKVKKMIMGDIELSPQLGLACHNDVTNHCTNLAKNQEGAVINCLMQRAGKDTGLEPSCRESVEEFIETVDPISDYQLNYALMANCGDYIDDQCKMEEGEGSVMKCLIDYEAVEELREECHRQILSYKYFMSRSIKLDKPLLRACKEDAKKLCKSELEEAQSGTNKPHGAVISCLYHHIFMEKENKLSEDCMPELKRTIIGQGESVNLSPSIVSSCADDLVKYCSGHQENKDDYGCLQAIMINEDSNKELSEECDNEMFLHAELVSKDVRNDYRLMKACRDPIQRQCRVELDKKTHGSLLGCLVLNKPTLKGSCLKHVHDLQLISLHDYKFNKEFVNACNAAVQTHCKGENIKKKQDVMYCLRKQLVSTEETAAKSPISEECKGQLRAEFLKQMSDLDLDPQLLKACTADLKETCRIDGFEDKLQVMECLRRNEDVLTPTCRAKVFVRELQQAEDPGIDPALQKSCGDAIKLYCSESKGEALSACLESNQHKSGVSATCQMTLRLRMVKEHSNYLLNIGLKKACKDDMRMFCQSVLEDIKKGKIQDGKGAVISCLKDNIDKISVECEDSIVTILEQEIADYKLDPLLLRFCQNDIKESCPDLESDQVEPCLREKIMNIKSEDCTKQVVRLITEAHSDVHLDPVLMRACQKDIGYLCGRVLPGKGQVIECLQANERRDKNSLTPTCANMLKSRVAMWTNAFKRAKEYGSALEMVDDLYRAIDSSKYKHELLTYLGVAVLLLVFLSFCGGRCTKRKPPSKLY